MTDTDIAYAAGLIDGEGTIYIGRRARRELLRRRGGGYWYYVWGVSLSNTAPELVRFMRDRWGGSISQDHGKGEGRRPQHHWVLASGEVAVRFLDDIEPYLQLKQRHVANVLALYRLQKLGRQYTQGNGRNGAQKTPDWLVDLQGQLFQAQRVLNRRGLAAMEPGGAGSVEIDFEAVEERVRNRPKPQQRLCEIAGCVRPVVCREGWCRAHWKRWRKWGDPLGSRPPRTKPPCSEPGCEGAVFARGLCKKHYSRWWYSTRRPVVRGLVEEVAT